MIVGGLQISPRATQQSSRCASAALLLGLTLAGCQPIVQTSEDPHSPVVYTDNASNQPSEVPWPGWRGGRSGGVSTSDALPVDWSADAQVVWRARVPGEGRSSPIVTRDAVILTAAIHREGDAQLAVLCFNRSDGTLRWQTNAGRVANPRHSINGQAAPTAATDGQRVFAYFGSGELVCLDLDGNRLWCTSLGNIEHDWGVFSSPVLFGELVIQLCDHRAGSFLVALNQQTGNEVWRTPRESYGSWSSPCLITVEAEAGEQQAGVELVVNGTGSQHPDGGLVIAYDPRSGKPLWQVRGTTDMVWPTAIGGSGLVFSTSGRDGPTLAIRPGGQGDVTADRVVWKHARGAPYVPTGVCYQQRLYLLNDNGVLNAFEAQSGNLVWSNRLPGMFTASLVAGDGNIYAVSNDGVVYVVAADDQFRLLARNSVQDRVLSTPAIAGGCLFLRTDSQLLCVSASTDSVAASADEDAPFQQGTSASPSRPATETDTETVASPSDRSPTEAPKQ